MINGIGNFPLLTGVDLGLEEAVDPQQKQAQPSGGGGAYVVTLSNEARSLAKANAGAVNAAGQGEESRAVNGYWEDFFGLSEGTNAMANGRRIEMVVDGDSVEILEYDSNRLKQKTTGVMGASGVDLTTEVYGRDGKVSQSIQTHFTGLDDDMALTTTSEVTRTTQWFEGRQVVRQMEESMRLSSTYSGAPNADALSRQGLTSLADGIAGGNGVQATDKEMLRSLLDFAGSMTTDKHTAGYSATITDFSNGRVSQSIFIEQSNSYTNRTNRSDSEQAGIDAHSTEEGNQKSQLSMQVVTYDQNGDLLRDVSFSDAMQSMGGEGAAHSQALSVSWYAEGELIKHSEGRLTMEQGENTRLEDRATLLQFLNVDEEEYATDAPLNASKVLSLGLKSAATDSGGFQEALMADVDGDAYGSAEDVAAGRAGDRPYRMEWNNEIYSEGSLVARQVDVEEATRNLNPEKTIMRTGGGLTENDAPSMLHSSEHIDESYENGQLVSRGVVASHEFVLDGDVQGPDKLQTATHGETRRGANVVQMNEVYAGGLSGVDAELHKASASFAKELGLSLEDLGETLHDVAGGAGSRSGSIGALGESWV